MIGGVARVAVGDVVRVRRDLTAGAWDSLVGATTIKRGRRGIVRSVEGGVMSTRLTVEFKDRWGTRLVRGVGRNAVARCFTGGGEQKWQRRQDYRQGARIGLFLVFGVPALVVLAEYFMGGGTLFGLIPALITEGAAMVLQLLLGPFGPVIAIGGVVWILGRRRR